MSNPTWTVRLHGHGGCAIFDHRGRCKRRVLTAAALAIEECARMQAAERVHYGIRVEEAPELHEAENKPMDLPASLAGTEPVEPA